MKNLNIIAEELFNKIRGRFPSITIGNEKGEVVNKPEEARYFDFDFKEGNKILGKVSISLDEKNISIMYNNEFVTNEDQILKDTWYDFLKEIRVFAKKRLLNFDTRDITKSNLTRRDYKFLSQNRPGDLTMESKMYGTARTSYQNFGNARLTIKHRSPIGESNRTSKIEAIYVENNEGERFKYPYKHINGARAMASHVNEGGKPFDDFGKHITGLSEELTKLKKFKTYMGRSSVMAESLAGYVDVVRDRIGTIKKTLETIQKPSRYKSYFENFEVSSLSEVPEDVTENWIDELTIKQFNEDLKDVFPYIYKLVSEATKAKEVNLEELEEGPIDWIKDKYADFQQGREESMAQYKQDLHILRTVLSSHGYDDATIQKVEGGCLNDPRVCLYNLIRKSGAEAGDMDMEVQRIGDELNSGLTTRVGTTDEAIEDAFESMMGQFSDKVTEGYMKGYQNYHCKDCGCQMHNCKPDCDCKHDSHDESGDWWVDKDGNGVPDIMEGNYGKKKKKKKYYENEQQLPITEFVLSMYDRNTGKFPKGETAVLTAVEKDYGEKFINPAKKFIEAINAKFEEVNRMGEGDNDDIAGLDDYDDDDSLYNPRRDPKGLKRSKNRGGVDTRAPIIDIDDMEFFLDDINEADQQTVAKLRTVQQNIEAGQKANDSDAIMAAGAELGDILSQDLMPEMYKFLDKFVREFEVACKKHANDPDPKWQQACKQLPQLKAELEQSKRDAMQAGMADIGRQDAGESAELERIRNLAGV